LAYYASGCTVQGSELVTAVGTCHWGQRYEFELSTLTRTYSSRRGRKSRSIMNFVMRIRTPGSTRWDWRWYDSEAERDAAIAKGWSAVSRREVSEKRPYDHPLTSIVGLRLNQITFVADYLQARFGDSADHLVNLFQTPTIEIHGDSLLDGASAYADAIRATIGKPVDGVDEYLDDGLAIRFGDRTWVVPLRSTSAKGGPEAAEYSGPKNQLWIWQYGTPPFEEVSEFGSAGDAAGVRPRNLG
jgi:hypothetical protein